jgi:membrane protein YdbS with pleckstrin-like domain
MQNASNDKVKKIHSVLWLTACVGLSLMGIAAFIFLFVPIMNVFWFILSPIVLAMYQVPAVYFFWRWKKWRKRSFDVENDERHES